MWSLGPARGYEVEVEVEVEKGREKRKRRKGREEWRGGGERKDRRGGRVLVHTYIHALKDEGFCLSCLRSGKGYHD